MSRLAPFALLVCAFAPTKYLDAEELHRNDPLPEGAIARLGTSRLRSTAIVMGIGDNGKSLRTLAGGRTLAVRDLATGRLRNERHLPGPYVRGASWFSRDGRRLAVPELAKFVVWDTATAKPTLTLPAKEVLHAAISRDGRFLVTTGYANRKAVVQLWNLATAESRLLATLPSYANDVAFSPDDTRVFAAVDNHSLRCWDTASGRQLWQNDHWARLIAVAPDGQLLAANSYRRGPILLWDAKTGKRLDSLGKNQNNTSQLAFSPDGRYLAEATWSDGVILWDVATRKVHKRIESAGPRVLFVPDGKSLVSLGPTIQRWDIRTGRALYEDTRKLGHVGPVTAVRFSPDGKTLASCGEDRTLRVWDLGTKRGRVLLENGQIERGAFTGNLGYQIMTPVTLSFNPDGKTLLIERGYGTLALIGVENGKVRQRFYLPQPKNRPAPVLAARFSADGKSVFALGETVPVLTGSELVFEQVVPLVGWNIADPNKPLFSSMRPVPFATQARFAPDGRSVVLSLKGQILSTTSDDERRLDVKLAVGPPLVFSHDGRLLVGAEPGDYNARPQTLVVYESMTGKRLAELKTSSQIIRNLTFGPEGRLVIATTPTGLHVWQWATGKRLLHIPAKGRIPNWVPTEFARSLDISPDGTTLATGHADGSILLWDLTKTRAQLELPKAEVNLETCWSDLAKDASTAHSAIEKLVANPERATVMLKKRLSPRTFDRQWLARQLRLLDSQSFVERESASKALGKVAETAATELRKELARTQSAEVRQRLRKLLERSPIAIPAPEEQRELRSLLALERIGSPEALTLLRQLASGAKDARLSREAVESVARLTERRSQR